MTTSHQSHTPAAEEHFDLIIIGTGSGNSIPSPDFDDQKIAIIEKGTFGGTCLNVGCIPTKMFVYSSEVAEIVTHAQRYGVDARLESVDWPAIRDRVFNRIDPISAGGLEYRVERCPNITVYPTHVEFDGVDDEGRYRLVTTDNVVLATEVVLAAGSRAEIPSVILDSGVRYYTNNDVMRLPELPERLIIVGSGYIAAEFAHVFGSLGTQVTILARGPRLLRKLDTELSTRFTDIASAKWDVRLERDLVSAENLAAGGVRLTLGDGGKLVDASLVPRRDGVEAGDEEKSGVAQASHLAGAIDDVGVRLDIADAGDNGGIGHG